MGVGWCWCSSAMVYVWPETIGGIVMDFGKILLFAVGGYFLYSFMSGQTQSLPTLPTDNASTNPSGTNTNGQSTVVSSPIPEPASNPNAITVNSNGPDLRTWMLHSKAVSGIQENTLTYDQWAWLFNEVYGIPAPPIEHSTVPGANRSLLLTVDQWIAATPINIRPTGIGGINTVAMATPYETLNIRNVN
jgi:hypothetical protein